MSSNALGLPRLAALTPALPWFNQSLTPAVIILPCCCCCCCCCCGGCCAPACAASCFTGDAAAAAEAACAAAAAPPTAAAMSSKVLTVLWTRLSSRLQCFSWLYRSRQRLLRLWAWSTAADLQGQTQYVQSKLPWGPYIAGLTRYAAAVALPMAKQSMHCMWGWCWGSSLQHQHAREPLLPCCDFPDSRPQVLQAQCLNGAAAAPKAGPAVNLLAFEAAAACRTCWLTALHLKS